MANVGRGLKLVAKVAFQNKVKALASPSRKTETHVVKDGKVNGVPLNVLLDAIVANGHRFSHTGDKLYIARR